MRTFKRFQRPLGIPVLGLAALAMVTLGFTSCQSPHRPERRTEVNLDPGFPRGDNFFTAVSYATVKGTIPEIPGAEYVGDDELCAQCHGAYAAAFATNVHHGVENGQSCEGCHGPASRHLETRGKEPGLLINFKTLSSAAQSEICLKCHEENRCSPGALWRNSKHAQCGVSCIDCHNGHYDVPPGTPATTEPGETPGGAAPSGPIPPGPIPPGPIPPGPIPPGPIPPGPIPPAPAPDAPSPGSQTFLHGPAVNPVDRLGQGPGSPVPLPSVQEPSAAQAPLTVRGQSAAGLSSLINWRGSPGEAAAAPVRHRSSNNMGAVAPMVCYKCHCDMQDLQRIAGPHQICGPNGFNCTTCHEPHGNIKEYSRGELCLQCHTDAPTMAWHSSTHALYEVACTDCHNPHPRTNVPQFVNISHTDVRRPERKVMAVEEPETCYKCHQAIYGLTGLPSHHPIKEGKMVCSDCHDAHGQQEGNLKGDMLNEVCYKCHADKQGPFVYEHPPVVENCGYCHNPHGAVANNLLKQPSPFLCLRCHSGHRGGPTFHDGGLLPDFAANPAVQQAFYTDCTQCHSQIHGSDVPTPHRPRTMMR